MNMDYQCLTRDQMKTLTDLGLNTDDASMIYQYDCTIDGLDYYTDPVFIESENVSAVGNKDIRTYNASDIIGKFPVIVNDGHAFIFTMRKSVSDNYQAAYYMADDVRIEWISQTSCIMINALYELLLYLVKNQYIK